MRSRSRRAAALIVVALVAAACTGDAADTGNPALPTTDDGGQPAVDPTRPCTTTALREAASTTGTDITRLAAGTPPQVTAAISRATFQCASDVVVVGDSDAAHLALGGLLAAGLRAPLLVSDRTIAASASYEIDRLTPARIWIIGGVEVEVPETTETIRLDGEPAAIAARVADEISATDDIPFGGTAGDAPHAVTEALEAGSSLSPGAPFDPNRWRDRHLSSGPGTSGWLWLIDHPSPAVALAAIAAAASTDGLMTTVTGHDLRASPPGAGRAISASTGGARTVITVGVGPDAEWQLPVIASGQELPGGGHLLLPGRRLVAIYGNPVTNALGILGHQGVEEAVHVARRIAEPYGADGVPVVPTFEIITTVAAAGPGAQGDYTNRMPLETLWPWIEVAAREDIYVVLDLQPGRAHLLDQAREYEELLLQPHVGLALDPEWKLEPDQLPLRQVGSVYAEEINQVSAWLAALVREHNLPQKLFLLHQFRFTMLPDRENIDTHPELATVIQMDGQGTIPDKYNTWNALTRGWEEHPWMWGWKNFTVEDIPGPIPPSEVLQLTPVPVFVSYQ